MQSNGEQMRKTMMGDSKEERDVNGSNPKSAEIFREMDNAERKRNNTRPRQEKNEKDIEDRLWAHCGLHVSLLARRTSTKCIREARVCMVYAVKCI